MKNRTNIFAALFALALTVFLAVTFAPDASATATTANRNTIAREGASYSFTVLNDAVIYQGTLVTMIGAEATNGADNTNHTACVGVAAEYVNNADDGLKVKVLRGVWQFANGGSFTVNDIGDLCYVEDNQTVTTASEAAADLPVGRIVDVDSAGVWVDTSDR
jgi:hypothetical protein